MAGKVWQLDAMSVVQWLLTWEYESLGWEEGLGYKPPRFASIDLPLPAMPPIPMVAFLNLRTVSAADNQVENISHQTIMEAKMNISESLSHSKLKGPSPSISEVVILSEDCHCSDHSGVFEG